MSTSTPQKCPQCGAALPANAKAGLCPRCVMEMNLATQTEFTGEPGAPGAKVSEQPPTPEELAAKFPQLEILELLGRGGMGAVYKARQKELDRIVALKILPPAIGETPGFAERFTREAKALAKLNHPNIVTIHDSGRADGLYFFVMEFVDGVTLRQLLHGDRISPHEALAIVPQICDALQYAHDHGIVHRDIKPENILMDRRGRVKVADFGLAKLVATERGSASRSASEEQSSVERSETSSKGEAAVGHRPALHDLTEAGKVMGTPHYMAPEQTENPSQVDHRADIYALGVVFYQMLTGELPGKRIEAPSKKVQIDVRLDEVVLRALENKPDLRYQTAEELKTRVETIATPASEARESTSPGKPDWTTWSPGQSPSLKEIGAHMTSEEKLESTRRAGFWGLWCAVTCFAAVFGIVFLDRTVAWFIGIAFILVQAIAIPIWLRMQREFSCSTAWAREQGIKPDKVRVFSFSGRNVSQPKQTPNETILSETRRPMALTIVAVLFILSGLFTTWGVVADWFLGKHNINFGVLALPIGVGLLRCRPAWRIAALTLLSLIAGTILVLGILAATGRINVMENATVKLFGNEITGEVRWPITIVANLVAIALLCWFFHVLMRADVRKLFIGRKWNRPWIEWVAFIGTFVLFVVAHRLVRETNASFTSIALVVGAIFFAIWIWLAQKPRTANGTEILNAPRFSRNFWKRHGWIAPFIAVAVIAIAKYADAQRAKEWQPQRLSWSANGKAAALFRVTYVGQEGRAVVIHLLNEPGLPPRKFAIAYQGPSVTNSFFIPQSLQNANGIFSPTMYGQNTWPGEIVSGKNVMQGPGQFQFVFIFSDAETARMAAKQARETYFGRVNRLDSGGSLLLFSLIRQGGKDRSGKVQSETLQARVHLYPKSGEPAFPAPFTARYEQGEIELVALANQPWNGVGWLPDGEVTTEFPRSHGGNSWAAEKVIKKMAFRIRSKTGNAGSLEVKFDPASGISGMVTSTSEDQAEPSVQLWVQEFACPPDAIEMNLQIGIADGAWEKAVSVGIGRNPLFGMADDGEWKASFQGVTNRNGDVAISFSFSSHDKWETRLVAVHGDGTFVPVESQRITTSEGLRRGLTSFTKEEFANIKEFQLQRRKYQWMQFRNVSLVPGHRTRVEVSDAPNAGKAANASTNSSIDPGPRPIPARAVQLLAEMKTFVQSHTPEDFRKIEVQKEIASAQREMEMLLAGTVAEPLMKELHRQQLEMQNAGSDSEEFHRGADEAKSISDQIEKLIQQADEAKRR